MYLSEGIINNFIESIDEEDILTIEEIHGDEEAYAFIANLYKRNYGTLPSGVGIYLLRNKFNLGREEENIKFIPNALL